MGIDQRASLGNSLGGGLFRRLSLGESEITPAGSTVLDDIPLDSFVSLMYVITVWDTATCEKVKILTMKVGRKSGSLVDSIYGKTGHPLSIALNSNEVGANMNLDFTNNEAFNLSIDVVRLLTPKT